MAELHELEKSRNPVNVQMERTSKDKEEAQLSGKSMLKKILEKM